MQFLGYQWLIDHFKLNVVPHFCRSSLIEKGRRQTRLENSTEVLLFPPIYAPGDQNDPLQQLEFALRYEGLNLEIIRALFVHLSAEAIADHVKEKAGAANRRRIWYLYEQLMGVELPVEESSANYVPLLDPKHYFTLPGVRSRRHRVLDNLLGSLEFAPTVRRTSKLNTCDDGHLKEQMQAVTANYSADQLARASRYLYTKETLSSFEIERERPDKARAARFTAVLQQASQAGPVSKEMLVQLQNLIVDPRFADEDYRDYQNYVGEQLDYYRQRLHYISPKPGDLELLMQGFLVSTASLLADGVPAIVAAAVVSFGFVLLHPFGDGNGRIHRYLVHHMLAKRGVTPDHGIFPVSAVMLRERRAYDRALERFSEPLLQVISDYDLSEEGALTVHGNTALHYRYPDLTPMAEFLLHCIQETLKHDLPQELAFLKGFDQCRIALASIVDMPDRLLTLFIRVVTANDGNLSTKKRERHFSMLSDDEISRMEAIVRKTFSGLE